MQQSSFVSGHSYTNLVRAFKPQASFPFGHTGGARGGSYSITYNASLMPFGNSIFGNPYLSSRLNQTAAPTGFSFDPTWTPTGTIAYTNNNKTVEPTGGIYYNCRSLKQIPASKSYFEVEIVFAVGSDELFIGNELNDNLDYYSAGTNNAAIFKAQNGYIYCDGTTVNTAWSNADILGIAIDWINHIVYFAVNNVYQNGDPSIPSGGCDWSAKVAGHNWWFFYFHQYLSGQTTLRTNALECSYSPPTGFIYIG
jgi:hypothetical protein